MNHRNRRALAVFVAFTLVVGALPVAVVELGGPDVSPVGTASAEVYNVSDATFVQNISVDNQTTEPSDVAFNDDGSKMYVVDKDLGMVLQYSLSTAFDISTASYDGDSERLDVSGKEGFPRGMSFGDNGTKLYVTGGGSDDIHQYNLSTAYDVSTGSFVQSYASGDTIPTDVAFNNDGTKMYVAEGGADDIQPHTLTTAWDISTASADSNTLSTDEPNGIAFNDDGTKIFTTDTEASTDTREIEEWSLSTAFNVSTATLVQTLNVSSEDNTPLGVAFNNDGSKMFMSGDTDNDIYEYHLTDATVSGFVKWSNGTLVGSASVTVNNSAASDTSASDGAYSLPLDNGAHKITATKNGESNHTNVSVSGSDLTGQNITIPAPSSGGSTTSKAGYLQTFELESSTPSINPQTTWFRTYYFTDEGTIGDGETGDRCNAAEGDQICSVETPDNFEASGEFDFRNQTQVRLYDDVLYALEVVDWNAPAYWQSVGFTAIREGGEGGSWNPDGSYTLVVDGPAGVTDEPVDPNDSDIEGGVRNDNGVWTQPPPIEQPEFGMPEFDTFLQTGTFFINGQRCIGLRFYDPNRETTELHYNFSVNGTRYEDTIVFDEPMGYFQTCIAEASVGPSFNESAGAPPTGDVTFNFTSNGTRFNDTFPFGEGGAAFDFGAEEGGFGVPIGGGGSGGGPGGVPTPVWIVAGVGTAYYLRKPRNRRQVVNAAKSAGRAAKKVVGRQ